MQFRDDYKDKKHLLFAKPPKADPLSIPTLQTGLRSLSSRHSLKAALAAGQLAPSAVVTQLFGGSSIMQQLYTAYGEL